MSLKYELSSEPLHIYAKLLFLNPTSPQVPPALRAESNHVWVLTVLAGIWRLVVRIKAMGNTILIEWFEKVNSPTKPSNRFCQLVMLNNKLTIFLGGG